MGVCGVERGDDALGSGTLVNHQFPGHDAATAGLLKRPTAALCMRAWMMLLLFLPLAGCLDDSEPAPTMDPAADVDTDGDGLTDAEEIAIGDDPLTPFMPRVTLAIIDTGLQPYHHEFRQVRAGENGFAHPATYVPGYPSAAESLPITLELDDYPADVSPAQAHLDHDAELWDNSQPETLYWLPGTKTIGFISFGSNLPGGGHGTMTSSRSTGNTISIPGDEVLLVNIRVPLNIPLDATPGTPEEQAVRWAADQDWIDIQSNSWGMPFMCAGPAAASLTGWMDAFRYARDKQFVFSATHNGHGNTGTVGYPSQCQDTAGPAGVIAVSATDNQGYASWSNWFPAIAADGCANPAVAEASLNETANTGGGTSSATPYSAGGMAKIILEARSIFRDAGVGIHDGIVATLQPGGQLPSTGPLRDGVFTVDEAKAVLFHTARSPPQDDPSDGDACLNQIPARENDPAIAWFPFIGYGEINEATIADALSVLRGDLDEPVRADEDALYEQDQANRRALYG